LRVRLEVVRLLDRGLLWRCRQSSAFVTLRVCHAWVELPEGADRHRAKLRTKWQGHVTRIEHYPEPQIATQPLGQVLPVVMI